MSDLPSIFDLNLPDAIPSKYDNHVRRTLSSLAGQFGDEAAYARLVAREDKVVYEVYEVQRPEAAGELAHGLSIVHPGKVGNEFFMTKGHFHTVLNTAEVYYCVKGQGCMVMETPDGECAVEQLCLGRLLYVPPRWAHRSVNTSRQDDLVTLFVYPADAGHDYGTIEKLGFRKMVVEIDGQVKVVESPRWSKT
ncbi:MAG: glucose-6-phosphate isomerase [Chloroflexi bacterium]|nr:glucose-6-phosphate isomerase [Chloroflexota bacterium]